MPADVQVLERAAGMKSSQQPYQSQAGEMILMPTGQPHARTALGRFKKILTSVRS
jgi:quercetin dioxygenase-like cupin family protein